MYKHIYTDFVARCTNVIIVWIPPVRWGSDCLRVPSAMERTMGIRFFFFSFWWWCLLSRASRTFTLTLSSSSLDVSWWSRTISAAHVQGKTHTLVLLKSDFFFINGIGQLLFVEYVCVCATMTRNSIHLYSLSFIHTQKNKLVNKDSSYSNYRALLGIWLYFFLQLLSLKSCNLLWHQSISKGTVLNRKCMLQGEGQ